MKKFVSLSLSLSALLLLALSTSCAYRFGSPERRIPGGYQAIAVPVFKNKSQEVSVETFFTQAMMMEVEKSSLARVTSKEESQAILLGEITSISYGLGTEVTSETEGFKDLAPGTALARWYTIYVTVDVKLVRSSDMAVLWEGAFNRERRYTAPIITKSVLNTANPLYNHSARIQNIQILSQDMMAEAYERLTENF